MYENGSMSPADMAAVMGNNNGFDNMGSCGGWFWLIILMLWFNQGGFGGNNNGYQRGFDQSAIMSGINGITGAVTNGFAQAEAAECARQMATMQQMNTIAMNQQQCCCENRAAVADLKYTVATEACADRAAISDALNTIVNAMNLQVQSIRDQMCQDKIDSKNEKIAELQNQLALAQFNASQNAQTAAILANNDLQTAALEQYLAPTPRPAYIVQNPNCCAGNMNTLV